MPIYPAMYKVELLWESTVCSFTRSSHSFRVIFNRREDQRGKSSKVHFIRVVRTLSSEFGDEVFDIGPQCHWDSQSKCR